MLKNEGITNSARYYKSKDNTFDVKLCLENNGTSILNAENDLNFIIQHSESFTEAELQFCSERLAKEFYTIAKTALSWTKGNLKKEKK